MAAAAASQNRKSRQSIDPEYYEIPHELVTIFVVLSLGFIMPVVLYAPQLLPSGTTSTYMCTSSTYIAIFEKMKYRLRDLASCPVRIWVSSRNLVLIF